MNRFINFYISSRKNNLSDTQGFKVLDKYGNAVEDGRRGLLTYNGGTVCDDGFGDTEANAICIAMGFIGSSAYTSGGFYESLQSSLSINLDDVSCEREDWSYCSYREEHNCGHSEDIFISCGSGTIFLDIRALVFVRLLARALSLLLSQIMKSTEN